MAETFGFPQKGADRSCHLLKWELRGQLGARAYKTIVCVFSFFLFASAGLSVQQLLIFRDGHLFWHAALIAFEWGLGVWLISFLVPSLARWVALGTLFAFTLVAGSHWWKSDRSCGCFGQIKIPPEITTLADVTMASTLFFLAPYSQLGRVLGAKPKARRVAVRLFVAGLIGTFTILFVHLLNVGLLYYKADQITSVIYPETLVGKPLLSITNNCERISGSGNINFGNWEVVFVDGDCSECHRVLDRVIAQQNFGGNNSSIKTCIIDINARSRVRYAGIQGLVFRASANSDFLAPVPFAVQLKDGVVVKQLSDF